MIPKKIHYCWFGRNPLPDLAKKCIESWKKYCPDYEIIEWNENNFDINYCDYVKEAYETKKWAFVADVARLYVLVNYGGIYMDTDMELIGIIDNLLDCEAFSGFESNSAIAAGIMGCKKENLFFKELLEDYCKTKFIQKDGGFNLTTNVNRITKKFLKKGLKLNNKLQIVNGFTLFPKDYFYPKDPISFETKITKNSLSIHHYDGSWLDEEGKEQIRLRLKFLKYFPAKFSKYMSVFIARIKYRGLSITFGYTIRFIIKLLRKNKGKE